MLLSSLQIELWTKDTLKFRFKENQLTAGTVIINFVKVGGSDLLDSSSAVLLLCDPNNYCILKHFTILSIVLELIPKPFAVSHEEAMRR